MRTEIRFLYNAIGLVSQHPSSARDSPQSTSRIVRRNWKVLRSSSSILLHSPVLQNMSSTVVMFLGFAFLIAITSAQSTGPVLNGEFKRFPGGHSESIKLSQDAWQSKDGNWRAGGYIQHDREKFNGIGQSSTKGGLTVSRMAEPFGDKPMLTGDISHSRFPGGHAESVKITHDAWQSRDGNWRAGGYIQHDRERFNGMRHSNTHGGLSITGRFRRNAEPDGNQPTLTGEISHTRYPGGHAESAKVTHDAWVSKDGNWRAGGYIQHDREKFNGMRHSNTHGGLSITGRFRRNAEPDGNRPTLTIDHSRYPGGHSESFKLSQDAWQSRDGNWRAGGYIQHDREKFNGMRHSNTHGGLSITGRFRRNAEPDGNQPTLTGEISHTRYPGGHAESAKVTHDAWVSKDGNWRAGGYIQHDREKFNGMRHSNTHGGLSITGRFRRNAEPDGNRPVLTIDHSRYPGGHSESFKLSQDAWVSRDGNWRAGGYVQHDREKFNGMRHSNTHGGLSITGRFRRNAEPDGNQPTLTGEISHTRFPGGHAESAKITHDAWVSRDGNWRAGGYIQHDREKFNGMRHSNTHGGLSITGRFRRNAEPDGNRPTLTIDHSRYPGGHSESFKLSHDAWQSRDGNWRAGGYIQHDREKFNGMRHSNTHGGLSITGRFRRNA